MYGSSPTRLNGIGIFVLGVQKYMLHCTLDVCAAGQALALGIPSWREQEKDGGDPFFLGGGGLFGGRKNLFSFFFLFSCVCFVPYSGMDASELFLGFLVKAE